MSKHTLACLALLAACLSFPVSVSAQVPVRGHVRSNGSYVPPHYRSNPDGIFSNNWSTYPNLNPYTGQTGARRTPSYPSPSYNSFWRW